MHCGVSRLGAAALVLLLLTACTAVRQRQLLTVFFDGVPPENSAAAVVAAPVTPGPEASVPELYLAARSAPAGVRHKPYAERQCTSCHESQFSQKLRGEVAEICLLCHQDSRQSPPFRHAATASGGCLKCHDAHESLEPALLLKPVRQLCADCHKPSLVAGSPAHAAIGDQSCLACHDPHGGHDRFYLRRAVPVQGVAAVPPAASP